jgi:hypothetical protein
MTDHNTIAADAFDTDQDRFGPQDDVPAAFDPWTIRTAVLDMRSTVELEWVALRAANPNARTGEPAWLRIESLWNLIEALGGAANAAHLAYAVNRTLDGHA